MLFHSIFRNVEKLGILPLDFSFGKLDEIWSIKTPLFDWIWILVCTANNTKSDWYAQKKKIHEIKHHALLKCYSMAPKFNYYPRNAWIVIQFGMCIESSFVKYILQGIWWQMKFGVIFWSEVKIDAWKGGGGCQQKGNDYTIFWLSNS